jgi:hypothetical protein
MTDKELERIGIAKDASGKSRYFLFQSRDNAEVILSGTEDIFGVLEAVYDAGKRAGIVEGEEHKQNEIKRVLGI